MKNSFWQWTWTIGTAAASAAVLYYFLPIQIALILLAVIISHEFGHVAMAKFLGKDASLPIFIPLGLLIIGVSRIKNNNTDTGQLIALAGPVCGAIVAILIAVICLITGMASYSVVALWFLLWEFFAATLGSDGKKFRKARRDYNINERFAAA